MSEAGQERLSFSFMGFRRTGSLFTKLCRVSQNISLSLHWICTASAVLRRIFGDKWSLLLIRDLMFEGRRHYREFLHAGEGIASNILADRLTQLETHGIVTKAADPTHGKRIVYRLAQKGRDMLPIMLAIMDWAACYDERTEVPAEFSERLRRQPAALKREVLSLLE